MGDGFGMAPIIWNGLTPMPLSKLVLTRWFGIVDPGFCNTNLQMVHVTIDLSAPENQNPKPELEDSEFIECFTVPLTDLYAECERLENEGFAIDARVGTIAEGIEIAKKWRLT